MSNSSLFPYSTMPYRLQHQDSQKGTVICFFQCQEHMDKYLQRYKIDSDKCIIMKADQFSFNSEHVNENKEQSVVENIDINPIKRKRGRPKKSKD
jgi:hypothetical protein